MRTLMPYMGLMPRRLSSDLWREFDEFFADFDRSSVYDERDFVPAVDMTESDDHYMVSVDLPGIKKEDIKIEMQNNVLSISGERKREVNTDSKEKVQRYERSYGFFQRSLTLPQSVESEKIDAQYENGVLQILLPKAATAKTRRIEVKSGKNGLVSRLLGSKEKENVKEDPSKAS